MRFAGLLKSTLVDYPGMVACVLFAAGCNMDCFYCHNRPLAENRLPALTQREVRGFLASRAGMLDGVVISGGEPTVCLGLVYELKWLKSLGYKVKLDTNGANPRVVERILEKGLCDYFAVDYKAPAARYAEVCGRGADAQRVLETIRLLSESGAVFEVRTTVIPQLSADDLLQMARELPPVPRYSLNRYRLPLAYPAAERERVLAPALTQWELERLAGELRTVQPNCVG